MFSKQRRRISMLVLFAMVLGVFLGAGAEVSYAASEKKVTIMHVNDVHGRIREDDYEGAIGFAKLKTKLDSLKKENPNTLLVGAGDIVHGTTEVNLTEGENIVNLMNDVGFDLMTPGNHDFNYGWKRLVELKDIAKFPIITANVVKDNGESDFDGTFIKEVDGLKLGFFGLTTEETAFKTHPDNTVGIKFLDPIESAKKAVAKLEKEKVDMVIGLVHLGNEGTTLTKVDDLLKAVDGIDLVIDGHSHEKENKIVNDTLLVQAGEYTKNLGLVDITFKDKKVEKVEASLFPYEEATKLKANPAIEKEIAKIEEANKPILEEVVGETKVKLDGEREDVRTKETNLGNLIADAMLASADADLAFTNGGGIRASIEKGKVTVGDIITTVPFTNTLAVVEAKGSEILAALERGVDSYPEQAGHFPQVAGMTYEFDPNQKVGQRIARVTIGGEALEKTKTYKVVTNDFIAAGGDGYTMFEGKAFVEEGGLLSDVLRAYFDKVKTVEPKVEGRIKIVEKQVEPIDPEVINIELDGKSIFIPESLGKVFMENNRTYIPIRAFAENLEMDIKWNGKTRTVTLDDVIKITIGEKKINVGTNVVEMDVEAKLIKGRTYVPVRFISEVLGYEVEFDSTTNTVIITTPAAEIPAA